MFVNAFKDGYFTDWSTARVVVAFGDSMNLVLYPHAWLRVTIKNESGAYGFYPPNNSSGIPPIMLAKGDARIIEVNLVNGNTDNYYGYSVQAHVDSLIYGRYLFPYCPGHDTTDLYIVY